jgi:hypothetical protein
VSGDQEKVRRDRAAELLFTDSSKNFSDLKSREWNATYYSVLAIVGLALVVHGLRPACVWQQAAGTVLMALIFLAHWVATMKCEANLKVFRTRIMTVLDRYFSDDLDDLFPDGKKCEGGARFQSAVVDEGRITLILYASTLFTLASGAVSRLVSPLIV